MINEIHLGWWWAACVGMIVLTVVIIYCRNENKRDDSSLEKPQSDQDIKSGFDKNA